MLRKERLEERDENPDAHARPLAAYDLVADIAPCPELRQIRLHGALGSMQALGEIQHGALNERPSLSLRYVSSISLAAQRRAPSESRGSFNTRAENCGT